ncbi:MULTISPECIES: hypothetical protein [Serratia]|uniref:hypothetical protein n=1 Tax=Serratia TaxID=613 RepID=UPI0012B508AE|nr:MULTISPECIES: hypothetical protein [Serratia]MBJ2111302.1 hypothetical protein [Serratia ureilytica]MCF1610090.1 hypothetical protein [Serratia marcescens]
MDWVSVAATSAVVSAAVAGFFTLLNSHLQRVAETKRRISETAMKMAILEWEAHTKIALSKGGNVQPPEIYLFRYAKLVPLIEKGDISAEDLAKVQQDVIDYVATNQKHTERRRAEAGEVG